MKYEIMVQSVLTGLKEREMNMSIKKAQSMTVRSSLDDVCIRH